MPRIRSVHPDICVSDTMATLSAELERTFVRLWIHCDDEGRCEDRLKIIKAAIYPLHDDVTPERLDHELDSLEQAGVIIRYEIEGSRLIQVRSWGDYQHPQKPRPSDYPKPTVEQLERSRNGKGNVEKSHASGVGVGVGEGEGVRSTELGEGVIVPYGNESLTPATRNGRNLSKGELLAHTYLAEVHERVKGGYAHDLAAEIAAVYTPAWQEAEDDPNANPKQTAMALLAAYLVALDEEPDYSRIGKLVGQWGKLAITGLTEAFKAPRKDPYTYAFSVCRAQMEEHNQEAT